LAEAGDDRVVLDLFSLLWSRHEHPHPLIAWREGAGNNKFLVVNSQNNGYNAGGPLSREERPT
jgi:hypothetical protein